MKHLLLALLAVVVLAVPARAAYASTVDSGAAAAEQARQADSAAGGEDDDRVEVQLAVLGAVIVSVFVLGTGAYLLRRRLGLTAYTPPKDAGHH